MPAPRNRKHLLVRTPPSTEDYTPHPRKIELPPIPAPRNRRQHAAALRAALQQAERETREERDELDITVHGAKPGLYIQFESVPGVERARPVAHLVGEARFQIFVDSYPRRLLKRTGRLLVGTQHLDHSTQLVELEFGDGPR
jgi:hypothetical protein